MPKLTFNDHIDDMMERLMKEDLKPEELDHEIKRGKALCQLAATKIEDKKTELKFVELMSQGQLNEKMIPNSFIPNYKLLGNESNA